MQFPNRLREKYLVNNVTFVLFRMDVHKNKDELGPVIFCTKEAEELEKMARSPKSGCSCSGMLKNISEKIR